MEPLFVNRYIADTRTLVEFNRKYRVAPRTFTSIADLVFFVLTTLMFLHYGIWGALYRSVIVVVLWEALIAILSYLLVWQVRRSDKKNNDGVIPETVVTFGDNIQIYEGKVHLTIDYRKVKRVIRLKHSYCLMTSRTTGVMLREDAFTKGSFEEFKQFLREKYPHLTIPE